MHAWSDHDAGLLRLEVSDLKARVQALSRLVIRLSLGGAFERALVRPSVLTGKSLASSPVHASRPVAAAP